MRHFLRIAGLVPLVWLNAFGAPQPDPVDIIRSLDATRWIGWRQDATTPVYLLQAGQPPRDLGPAWETPRWHAVSGTTFLVVGRDFVATAPVDGSAELENTALTGEWHYALGNAKGFVIIGESQVMFSPDGQAWKPVEGLTVGWPTRVLGVAASDDAFAVLTAMEVKADGTTYQYSGIARSVDGLRWESVFASEPQMGNEPELDSLGYGGGRWVAAGTGSHYTSTDGVNWDATSGGRDAMPQVREANLHFGGGEWWAVDWKKRYEFSKDGLDWSAEPVELEKLPGAGPFWTVGPQGMVNLSFDDGAKLRVRTLAQVRDTPESPASRVTVIKPEALRDGFAGVRYQNGQYTLPGEKGRVYFSTNLTDWQVVPTDTSAAVFRVEHDGERWIASTRRGQVSYSEDGRNWTPYVDSAAALLGSVNWRGAFWSCHKILGISATYQCGLYGGGKDVLKKDFDWRLLESMPVAVWRDGGRLHIVLKNLTHLTSDNGEYWQREGNLPVDEPDHVFFAAGNGREVFFADNRGGKVTMAVRTGDGSFETLDSPVVDIHGLAYGAGRFVVMGPVIEHGPETLLESTDGKVWTSIVEWKSTAESLVHGPAGFVANDDKGNLLRYQPDPLPELPPIARGPTPIPEVELRDFGQNYVGQGKFRRNLGPKTPDQIREKELYEVKARAARGDIAAQLELAFVLLEARHAFSNPWRAELYFNNAREAGEVTAARGYAELLAQWKPETPPAQIHDLYRESARRGDAGSVVWLALMLPPDSAHAAEIERWRAQAAAQDPAFAARWERHERVYANIAAAEAGDNEAIGIVALELLSGEAVPKDRAKGLAMLWRAVEQDYEPAAVFLIQTFESEYMRLGGREWLVQPDEYRRLLTKLSETGNKAARARLIGGYLSGRAGFSKDEKKAYELALELANTGDVDGMLLVGGVLLESTGPVKDEAAAREWLGKAAAAGNAAARLWLEKQKQTQPVAP
ncbi:MAG: hypothetical protein ABII82_11080 [Verrucomicrobiota bacterium]